MRLSVLAISIQVISAVPVSSDSFSSTDTATTSNEDLFLTDIGYCGITATSVSPFMTQTNPAAITLGPPNSSHTLARPI